MPAGFAASAPLGELTSNACVSIHVYSTHTYNI